MFISKRSSYCCRVDDDDGHRGGYRRRTVASSWELRDPRYRSFYVIMLLRTVTRCTRRLLSTSSSATPKAIVYSCNGDPVKVLRGVSLPPLPSPPPPGTLNVRYLLSPINPADLNTIEGVYPSKPSLRPPSETGLPEAFYVAGNEGLAQVVELGDGVDGTFNSGDWVVMTKPQSGTWQSKQNVREDHVQRIPRDKGTLSEVHGATLTVCARFPLLVPVCFFFGGG